MYDLLLFLHLLAAAGLFAAIATFSAVALGAVVDRRSLVIANANWGASLLAIIVVGILLVVVDDTGLPEYDLFEAWIVLAVILWVAAGGLGDAATRKLHEPEGGGAVAMDSRQRMMHWLRVLTVIAALVLMIWKPGA